MNELRKLRLTREAIGDQDPMMPGAEALMRTLGIVALVAFVVLFSGTFQA